ncbi:MAG: TonB-dependent receptor, partial [Bacteroidetes bacterium]
AITNYSVQLNFNYFGRNSEVRYGFDFSGLETDFVFKNLLGVTIQQNDFTTELAGYVTLKQIVGRWVFRPGLRAQFYVSQPATSIEPRLGAKFNATERLRFKFAGGLYSQNILSSVNERDVINLFVGFLSGPEQTIYKPGTTEPTAHRLQKSQHAIAGFEADLTDRVELNVEGYFKNFSQLIQVNRNKRSARDPDFTTETGKAYGVDVSLRYSDAHWYVWTTYSLGHVIRDDGEQVYPTIFDRRHNVNLLVTRTFGAEDNWEAALRWNLGTGFPFTLTQGFYENFDFQDGVTTDVLTGNGSLGVIFDERRNAGRLPDYHRLDLSLKRVFHFGESQKLEVTASVTNAYNRENIFFFDRIRYKRVNQLPVLPSLGLSWEF